ncbi:X-ray radiation resistance-associated protein 1 [Branchiostoma belcheri]|nr:X-ray radiation resistance-associated protein 1 [Branchiostoma belcheri]
MSTSKEDLEQELRSAAGAGDEEKVKRLLRQGVDVNCRGGRSGDTPLHKAASGGHVGVAELLLEDVARVDIRNLVDERPLHSAAAGGHVGVAELLLKVGARVNSRDEDEATPLHYAASGRHVGVAELLLKAGAQVDSRDWYGRTPEDIAARTPVPSGCDKDRVLEGRKKILELFAAEKISRPYMHKLKVGPEGGELRNAYCTVSVSRGAVTMETEITCQVIDPNDVTLPLKDGEMLVSDVIELGPHGTTFRKPVTVEMQYNSKSSGVATEAAVWVTEDRSQWTELETSRKGEDSAAVSVNHFSIFAVISQPKQDKFTVPSEGFKLTSSTQPAVQISFPEHAVTTDTQVTVQELRDAARRGDEEKVTELLQQGVDVNCTGWLQNTPLQFAASGGHVGVAKLLLKAGARVDSRNQFEATPLHSAASRGHVGVAELLLEAGARMDSRNLYGRTPEDIAASTDVPSWQKDRILEGRKKILELFAAEKLARPYRCKVGPEGSELQTPFCTVSVPREAVTMETEITCQVINPNDVTLPLKDGELLVSDVIQLGPHGTTFRKPVTVQMQYNSKSLDGATKAVVWVTDDRSQWTELQTTEETDNRVAVSVNESFIFAVVSQPKQDKFTLSAVESTITSTTQPEVPITSPYMHKLKVGPEGDELQTAYCTVSVPRGAVTMETDITCQVINPNDVTLPLKDGEMLVSDIIELGPHGTTFRKPVTVQMQYNSKSLDGAREAVVWVTEDRSQWKELETSRKGEDRVAVSVDHFSIFAVISQPKHDQFTVPTEGFKLTSSTQPAVQISFPEHAVNTPTEVKLAVQEVPQRAVDEIKAKDYASRGLVGTSPIVKVENVSGSEIQKPVTVRFPHPQPYMNIQHEGPTKLKLMSRKKEGENWMDVTDDVDIKHTPQHVEAGVRHFASYIAILVEEVGEPKEIGQIMLDLCDWLQRCGVQFIVLQSGKNPNLVHVQCCKDTEAEERHAQLRQKGYTGLEPSRTVRLLQGQRVKVSLEDNVSFAKSDPDDTITFHSLQSNLLQFVVKAEKGQEGLPGHGVVVFYELAQVVVTKEELVRRALQPEESSGELKPTPPHKLCEIPVHVPYRPYTEVEGPQHATNPFSRCCMWIARCCGRAEAPGGPGFIRMGSYQGVGKYFFFIKENVSSNWKDLAFHLGFNAADEDNIAGRNRDDKSRCWDVLEEWQKREGNKATIEVLINALENAGLRLVVDGLRDRFPVSKMAAAGVYKLDDGKSTPNITSCFPVRGVLARQAEEARQKSSKIASRHKLAAILDIVGNVRYRRRERSVASRLPKRDRKLSDYNRKGYRAFPTAPEHGCWRNEKKTSGAGAWLLAKREEDQRRFKAVLCAKPRDLQQIRTDLRRTNTLSETPGFGSRFTTVSQAEDRIGLLDGFFLMRVHCVDDPSDLCAINISDKELFRAKEVDFQLFDNVAYINAGENTLPFEIFRYFPIVRELELPVNNITNINVNIGDFQHLEVLDLSYNSLSEDSSLSLGFLPSLSEDSILSLGFLPRLKVLHLTGNQLKSLPPEMARPHIEPDDLLEENPVWRFAALEILFLDDNKLTELQTFASLAGLKKLKHLHMDHNQVYSIPHLRAMEGGLLESPSFPPQSRDSRNPAGQTPTKTPQLSKENVLDGTADVGTGITPEIPSNLEAVLEEDQGSSGGDEEDMLDGESAPPPFPELRYLSIAHNMITEEEDLIALAAWPLLSEVVIHSNPLTTKHSGDPPLLKRFLTDRLGINLVRLKPGELQKPPVVVEQKQRRTVKEQVRKVPKLPLYPMLEGPPPSAYTLSLPTATDLGTSTPPSSHMPSTGGTAPRPEMGGIERAQTFPSRPLPPISSTQQERPRTEPSGYPEADSDDSMPGLRRADAWEHLEPQDSGTREGKRQPTDDSEPIFLTQIDDQGEEVKEDATQEKKVAPPEERRRKKHRRRKDKVPEKYKGYEILLDADTDVGTKVPTDINGTVRALEYALKHPLVFRDTAVDLSTVQKPFQPARKTRAMPPAPTRERRIEKLDRMLDQMKDEITVIETSLASALKDKKKFKREFPEAAQLLGEVQAKYNTVRAQSMQEHRRVQQEVRQTVQDIMDTKEKIRQLTTTAKDS